MWNDQRGSTEFNELQLTRGFSRQFLGRGFKCAFDIRFVCFWSHGLNDRTIKTSAAMPCCRIHRGGTALLAALVQRPIAQGITAAKVWTYVQAASLKGKK